MSSLDYGSHYPALEMQGINGRMLEDFSSVNGLGYVFLFRRKASIDITKLRIEFEKRSLLESEKTKPSRLTDFMYICE
ncbi:hypothetical protein [Candidatus Methanoperedens nitratireducens]|uniref:Uncharacterized protein n=1 Tax=Candidatus Methanoperedens nitratireducens TaxID=1392998 RepID=A0A284VIY7_9EURY|nr:hypothetical protein [Candidatus Methanoperedens nitroreducens]SNQ59255.1 hypothetical protein MNV_1100032 [Candidatus Methanoperedens nitroreducens]